jgi:hypothetical protein
MDENTQVLHRMCSVHIGRCTIRSNKAYDYICAKNNKQAYPRVLVYCRTHDTGLHVTRQHIVYSITSLSTDT